MMTPETILRVSALPVLAFLLTYLLHSTLLLGGSWLATRFGVVKRAATLDALWKLSLVGGLLTAGVQTMLGASPLGGDVSLQELGVVTFSEPRAAAPSPAALAERSHSVAALQRAVHNTSSLPPEGSHLTGTPMSKRVPRARVPANAGLRLAVDDTAHSPAKTEAARLLDLPTVALGAWGLVALIGLLRSVALRRRLRRVLGARRPVLDGRLVECIDELCEQAGLRRRIQLTTSAALSGPVAIGRAEICLPPRALSELSPTHQRAMLAHELAHLVRHDPSWLSFCNWLEAVFFFQPLNRVGRRQLETASEYLCDDWAVARTGHRVAFAACLAEVASWVVDTRRPALVPGMARNDATLVQRVQRIAQGRAANRRRSTLLALSLAVLSVVGCGVPVFRADDGESLYDSLLGTLQGAVAEVAEQWNEVLGEEPTVAEPTVEQASAEPTAEPANTTFADFRAPLEEELEPDETDEPLETEESTSTSDSTTQITMTGDLELSFDGARLQSFDVDELHFVVRSDDVHGTTLLINDLEVRVDRLEIRQADDESSITLELPTSEAGELVELFQGRHASEEAAFGFSAQEAEELDREFGERMEELHAEYEELFEEYEREMETFTHEWELENDGSMHAFEQEVEELAHEYEELIDSFHHELEPTWEHHEREFEEAMRELEQEYEELVDQFEDGELGEDLFEDLSDAWENRHDAIADVYEAEWEQAEASFEREFAEAEVDFERAMSKLEVEWEWVEVDLEREFEMNFEDLETEFEFRFEALEDEMDDLEFWYAEAFMDWEAEHLDFARDCDHDCETECAQGCTHPEDATDLACESPAAQSCESPAESSCESAEEAASACDDARAEESEDEAEEDALDVTFAPSRSARAAA